MTIGKAIVERMVELNFDTDDPHNVEIVASHLGEGRVWIVSRPTGHFSFVEPHAKMKKIIQKGLWPK